VPILGYDVAPGGRKLLVNEAEAEQVRAIFGLYQEHRSIAATLQELHRRGWRNKAWTSGTGHQRGGASFSKSTLARLLGSVLYTGRVLYRREIFAGDHAAIIDITTFETVRRQLTSQHRSGGAEARTKHFPLLKGLLACAPCGCGMTYTYSKRGAKLYGYYTCARSREHGAATCPMPSLPAAEIERLVVDEIGAICRNPDLAGRVIAEAAAQQALVVKDLHARLADAEVIAAKAAKAAKRAPDDAALSGLRRQADAQVANLRMTVTEAKQAAPKGAAARATLRAFASVWAELTPRERQQLLRNLVERVTVDGDAGKVAFTFRSEGIAALAQRAGAA
jgi:site-specific DNA recombinase